MTAPRPASFRRVAACYCAQCGTHTNELYESIHGLLCPQCAWRQNERDEPGYGLAPGTFGFHWEDE